jgi:glycosyltransferase involved in cell wall biosynthesis
MVSTSYPVNDRDWQGRFIADMAAAVGRKENMDVALWAPPGKLPSGVTSALADDDRSWLSRLLERGGIAHLLHRHPIRGLWAALGLLRRLRGLYRRERTDVVHVNWLQNALPLMGTTTPALITVLGSDFALLRLPGMTFLLRRALASRTAILAPNASWMVPELEHRFGDLAEIRPIPFGVDNRWFNLQRCPTVPHRWLAVTRLTRNKIGDLFAWGDGLFGEERELHLFGPMQEEIAIPDWVIWHGPTNPDELARDWFHAAAGLITLSRHDEGRPQILLEAMATGLPVIASDLPAHRDFVQHGDTGWLADSAAAFAEGLDQLETPEINHRMGTAARQHIHNTIGDWDDCASRYSAAYRDLLERNHG